MPIWKRTLHKQISEAGFWRQILISEEGPRLFKVVLEDHLVRREVDGKMKQVVPAMVNHHEWTHESREAAIIDAKKRLEESMDGGWSLSAELSVGE
jgi:hypothetical protein